MEKLLDAGKVRAIGVSNFTINRLDELLSKTTIVPAVNQIEVHPYLQQPSLFDYCKSKNILIEAYSPLGNNQTGEPRTVDDALVGEEYTEYSGAEEDVIGYAYSFLISPQRWKTYQCADLILGYVMRKIPT